MNAEKWECALEPGEFDMEDWAEDDPGFPTDNDYVLTHEGPFTCLLKYELRQIERQARMTERQATAFDWATCYGLDTHQIAAVMDLDESTVRQHLDYAIRKAETLRHIGVLTVMVETFGWRGLMEIMRRT